MTAASGFPAFPARPGRRGRSWWAREFVAAMEDATHSLDLLRKGRRFAGSGRIGPITISPGRIAAAVDDPDGVFDVVVRLAELTDAEWARFLAQVGAEAGHLAALLDGEVPRTLVASADAADVALLPTIGDLESFCDCPDIGDPCQHAAALCYQTAWLLDDDPLILLLLRGRDRDALLGHHDLAPEPEGDELDRPVPASVAFAVDPVDLPEPTHPRTRRTITTPPAPGLPEDALPLLVASAAETARALLDGTPLPSDLRDDALRWAAHHPEVLPRVRAVIGEPAEDAVADWQS
ncbi:SWIM zinc finger family protein [Actinomycetes bacterium KLBMP 9759]